MKFPVFRKISLAAKVRLLFGAALLLIIAAALFVPWDRMERLSRQQDIVEAQRAATLVLLERCSGAAAPRPAAQGEPAHPLEPLWQKLRMGASSSRQPRTELLVPPPPRNQAKGLVAAALEHFEQNPRDLEAFPSADSGKGRSGGQREIEYFRALRITGSCVQCHVGENAVATTRFNTNELAGIIHVTIPAATTSAQTRWNRISVVGAGLLALILGVLVFYVIMQSLVLSPVRRLRRLADRIGEGELSVRSTISTGDEFERLAKAFNQMLERLQSGQQQMRQINESLNSKMDELARANIALFESNRLKSEFLARVSHELRTPLNSIIGFAEVLRDQMIEQQRRNPEETQAGKAARYADNILTSGRMLLELINDLLDLAKIEAGKMVVRLEKVVIRELVEAVVNFMRPSADKKNLSVQVAIDADLPLVTTDGGKFQQILYNLFSNAVKFTPPRGKVVVRARRLEEGQMQLSVSDTGPGIPPEDHEAIFEKFHQLDTSATREHGGTGLGLAISRELASMLGGRLGVSSKLGEGSTFSLTIPLEPPPKDEGDRPAGQPPDAASDAPAEKV
ncbi:MAG: Sensor histidine kinase RcsC [Phycisphaerae bacterium]|nr:Sensor histidine kinase RcsC [Phycisphaerae bacterium]